MSNLPEDGEVRLGPVALPAGRRVWAGYKSRVPVAWVTSESVTDPGRVWSVLSQARPVTGLVPFLLASMDDRIKGDEETRAVLALARDAMGRRQGDDARPWDNDDFIDPADVTELDRMDAAELLTGLWDSYLPPEDQDDGGFRMMRAPFSRQFPGLAPAERQALSAEQLDRVLRVVSPARIGLAPAARPADVLPLIGWAGTINHYHNALPVAAVLRSWEDRFGATLFKVGFDEIRLLVHRPPRTSQTAQILAAEQCAFCDECGNGLRDVPSITDLLLTSPFWTFWWD